MAMQEAAQQTQRLVTETQQRAVAAWLEACSLWRQQIEAVADMAMVQERLEMVVVAPAS